MTCGDVQAQITAYLAGELDEPRASSLRGHLRLCEACRALAGEHARMIDVLATLPAPEPPVSMWSGVKARLGAAEIEDAHRSRLALWWRRVRPQLVPIAAGTAAAAALAMLWIAHRRALETPGPGETSAPAIASGSAPARIAPPAPGAPGAPPSRTGDVTEELADDDVRADAAYRSAADELVATIADDRADWSAAQSKAFDTHLAALRAATEHAPLGAARERAWQALIDYVQRAAVGVRVAEVP